MKTLPWFVWVFIWLSVVDFVSRILFWVLGCRCPLCDKKIKEDGK